MVSNMNKDELDAFVSHIKLETEYNKGMLTSIQEMVSQSQAVQRSQATEFAAIKVFVNPLYTVPQHVATQISLNLGFNEKITALKSRVDELEEIKALVVQLKVALTEQKQ